MNIQTTEEILIGEETQNRFSWEVVEKPVFNERGDQIKGFKALKRSDTDKVLNVCKSTYKPLSNEDLSIFADKLSELTNLPIVEALDFDDGKKQMIFFEPVKGQVRDIAFSNRIVLGNSHDGSSSVYVALQNVIFRCTNMFSIASRNSLKVSHTMQLKNRLYNIGAAITYYERLDAELKVNFERLINTRVSQRKAEDFIYELNDTSRESKISTRKQNIIEKQMHALHHEAKELGYNAFLLFNSTTYYTSHIRASKNKELINSSSNLLNKKSYELALEYTK